MEPSPAPSPLLSMGVQFVWPPFALGLLIGLPSAVLYLAQILVMLGHWHKFDSSFFLLFIIRSIPNLLNLATSYLGQRFGKVGLLLPIYAALPRLALCFFYFAGYYFFHAENFANLFLLLNRLTSIAYPLKHTRIWHFLLPLAILATFLLPLTYTIQIFFVNMFLYESPDGLTFTLNYTYFDGYKDWPIFWRKGNNFMAAYSAVIFAILCLAINFLTILLLKNNKITANSANVGGGGGVVQNGEMRKRCRLEWRMTIYAILTFVGQLLMAAYYYFFYWVSSLTKNVLAEETTKALYTIAVNNYPWINDISTIALPAWLMIWASERMRRLLRKEFHRALAKITCKRFVTPSSTTIAGLTRLHGTKNGNGINAAAMELRPSILAISGTRRPSHLPFGNVEMMVIGRREDRELEEFKKIESRQQSTMVRFRSTPKLAWTDGDEEEGAEKKRREEVA